MNYLAVPKTVKLFINGEFPRTESGRSFPLHHHKSEKVYANFCLASRKDLRNAVSAAKDAQRGWEERSAFNRSQILYRMAEMAESKREELVVPLVEVLGWSREQAETAVNDAVNSFVFYSGFADKYQSLMGTVNPVSGPHHNFTTAEATGVVGLICAEKFSAKTLVSNLCAVVCSGNTLVALLSDESAVWLAPLSEIFATSDLPKGVVNLLSGTVSELYQHYGSHMEIQSVMYLGTDAKVQTEIEQLATETMKRVVRPSQIKNELQHVLSFVEYKTVWHPVGH